MIPAILTTRLPLTHWRPVVSLAMLGWGVPC